MGMYSVIFRTMYEIQMKIMTKNLWWYYRAS